MLFAEVDEKPVGVAVTVPNYNEVLIHMNGRLDPIGIAKFLYYRKKIKGLRSLIMGMLKEYRLTGIPVLLFTETAKAARKLGYEWCETSWNLEDNHLINKFDETIGGRLYKNIEYMKKRFKIMSSKREGLIMNAIFDNLKNEAISIFLRDLSKTKVIRNAGVKFFEKMWEDYVERNILNFPVGVQEDKYYLAEAYLNTAIRALNQNLISKNVLKKLIHAFESSHFGNSKTHEFKEKYGFEPPLFLTISPTKFCNLRCTGCYASSSKDFKNKLPYDIVKRILQEKQDLWGRHFTVISGGEPFVYRDSGKGIIDLAAEFPDQFFLVYTNGTLIDKSTAEKLAEVGNMTPAISVEGFEEETDARRGKGVFKNTGCHGKPARSRRPLWNFHNGNSQ